MANAVQIRCGCGSLKLRGSRCQKCSQQRAKEAGPREHMALYNTARWRTASKLYLGQHPLCRQCEREGRVTSATDVHHVIAHQGDHALFWDVGNWEPICKSHHAMETFAGR